MTRAVTATLLLLALPIFVSGQARTRQPAGDAAQGVRQANEHYREAIRLKNLSVLREIVSDDFLLIDRAGQVMTKTDFLDLLSNSEGVEVPTEADEVKVRVYGEVAVLTQRASFVGVTITDKSSGQWRETNVFVKRHGRWLLASSQETRVRAG